MTAEVNVAAQEPATQLGDESRKESEEGSIAKRRKTRHVKRPRRYLNWLEQDNK